MLTSSIDIFHIPASLGGDALLILLLHHRVPFCLTFTTKRRHPLPQSIPSHLIIIHLLKQSESRFKMATKQQDTGSSFLVVVGSSKLILVFSFDAHFYLRNTVSLTLVTIMIRY
jgi:hypothetical protein